MLAQPIGSTNPARDVYPYSCLDSHAAGNSQFYIYAGRFPHYKTNANADPNAASYYLVHHDRRHGL